MPDHRPNIIERAFDIAREGKLDHVAAIASRLSSEGYHNAVAQLNGPSIRRQLSKLLIAARKPDGNGDVKTLAL